MNANLAFADDCDVNEEVSAFSRSMARTFWIRSPRVDEYSISGSQVTPINRAHGQFKTEIINSSQADFTQLNAIAKLINQFLSLDTNWDTYGGKPTTEVAARKAMNIITSLLSEGARAPAVVPVNNGGVQIEWHNGGWDVEIEVHPDGSVSTFIDNGVFNREWENHQLPQDRQFIEALQVVTATPVA